MEVIGNYVENSFILIVEMKVSWVIIQVDGKKRIWEREYRQFIEQFC